MKKIYPLSIAFFIASVSFASDPVACYPFSGNANDVSGNGHNGVVNGATLTTDRFGNPNSAYLFNGVSDYINLGIYGNIIPSGNEFSLSVWIKAIHVKQQTILMINPDDNSDRLNAMAYYDFNGPSYTFWDYGNIAGGGRCYLANTTLDTLWEHYVYVVSDSLNYMRVYKNGVVQTQLNSNSTITNRNRDLRIGGAYDHLNTPFFFDGKIDDLQIFDHALDSTEVQQLYLESGSCAGSVNVSALSETAIIFGYLSSGNILMKSDRLLSHCIVELHSVDGKLIRSEKAFATSDEIEILTSGISNGIYILSLRGNDVNYNRKFSIVH